MRRYFLLFIVLILCACQPAPALEPTQTAWVITTTPLPTTSPTTTPAPTDTPELITVSAGEGVLFEGPGVSIILPSTYIAASKEDMDTIIDYLEDMGGYFAQTAQMLRDNPDLYLVYAYDTVIGPSGAMTSMNVTTEAIPTGFSLEAVVQAITAQYQNMNATLEQTSDCSKAGFECARLTVVMDVQGTSMKLWQYILKNEATLYAATFGTSSVEFEQRQTEFENSFESLQID